MQSVLAVNNIYPETINRMKYNSLVLFLTQKKCFFFKDSEIHFLNE